MAKYIIVFLLLAWRQEVPLFAASVFENSDQFQEALYDNPKALVLETERRWKAADVQQNPKLWTEAFVQHIQVLVAIDANVEAIPDLDKQLALAKSLAETWGLYPELLKLIDFEIDRSLQSNHPDSDETIIHRYEDLMQLADRYHLRREKAILMAYYANYLLNIGKAADSLKILESALKTAQSDPKATEFDQITIKGYMAVSLWFLGDFDKYLARMQQIESFCSRNVLRFYCSPQLYNLGLYYVEHKEVQDFALAESFFQRSIAMAEATDDFHDIALCRYGLGTLYLRQHRWEEALRLLQQALTLFQNEDDRIYQGKTLVNLGQAQLGMNRFREALDTVEKAHAVLRSDMKRDRDKLQELRYQIYRKSNRKDEALVALETYFESFKKSSEELQKQEYSKAMTAMGLQIEEEKNQMLQLENERKRKELQRVSVAAAFLLLMLVLVVVSMLMAARRGRQVRAAKEKMQLILDTIDEGIVSVGPDLIIRDEHSPFIQQLFPNQKLSGMGVVQAIFEPSTLNPEEIGMAHQALCACMGEDLISWELNVAHLPQEILRHDGRSIALHWQPMVVNQQITRVLLAIRDVTDRRQLEKALAVQQQKITGLQNKMVEILGSKFQDVKGFMDRLLPSKAEIIHDLKLIHTAKGEARSLGLKDLSLSLHQLEDAFSSGEQQQIAAARFLEQVDEYLHLMNDVFAIPATTHRLQGQLLEVCSPLVASLRQEVEHKGLTFAGVEVLDHVTAWNGDALNTVRSLLVHALANALDHGYILPRTRGLSVPDLWIQIEASQQGDLLRLQVRDRGVGLDWTALNRMAAARAWSPATPEFMADVVFEEGVSTADSVTQSSGRGVGLAAVRDMCRQRGGEAHLTNNDQGSGAMLILEFRTIPIPIFQRS